MYWEFEKDGCESEFIVGSFDKSHLYVCSRQILESIFRDMIFKIYPLLFNLHAFILYKNVRKHNTITV